jgi:hypothetical protein
MRIIAAVYLRAQFIGEEDIEAAIITYTDVNTSIRKYP